MTLFDDPRVIEAAGKPWRDRFPIFDAGLVTYPMTQRSLNAALAALPREELIEKGGRALCALENEREADRGRENPAHRAFFVDYDEWSSEFNGQAETVLMAVGLIPEHVTPEEER